ncbi:MAG TPA: glycogen-binding domain-containing protein [Verrucomicrobiae bacterium]|nr:glycogen-binding domain-containing protein [Verrucomicrobiae bacterium]
MSRKSFATVVVTALAALTFYQRIACADEEITTTFAYNNPNAATVALAGEFSNWRIVPMAKDATGKWAKTLQLKPGIYGYKFVVDGDWRLDPANPARKTVNEIEDSAITVGNVQPVAGAAQSEVVPVTFQYANAKANSVQVAGEFNHWLDNVDGKVSGKSEWQMQTDGAGNWTYTTELPPGRYKFKYVINGGAIWQQDPVLPPSDDGNSIIEVKDQGRTAASSQSATASQVTFTYADPSAKEVFLAGQFNNWSPTATALRKDDAGVWSVAITLKPGRYQYKFVVDGDWRVDPANPNSTDDGSGNINSLKTVQ